jgi:hypothetical protein
MFIFSTYASISVYFFKIPATSSAVTFPYTSSLTSITGANPHAPTHLVASIENNQSSVQSPDLILSLLSTSSNTLSAPFT